MGGRRAKYIGNLVKDRTLVVALKIFILKFHIECFFNIFFEIICLKKLGNTEMMASNFNTSHI